MYLQYHFVWDICAGTHIFLAININLIQYRCYYIFIPLWIKIKYWDHNFIVYLLLMFVDMSIIFIILGMLKWISNQKSFAPGCNKIYVHKKPLGRHLRQECGIEPYLQYPYCPCRARRAYILAFQVKSNRQKFTAYSLPLKWFIWRICVLLVNYFSE